MLSVVHRMAQSWQGFAIQTVSITILTGTHFKPEQYLHMLMSEVL